jgi:diguanylate cyclase (GGDEF)-like protein/PAS domain S-box-containing protein
VADRERLTMESAVDRPQRASPGCAQERDPVAHRRFQRGVRGMSGAAMAGATLILVGHVLGVPVLRTLGLGRTPATPAAAAMLLGLGLAILAVASQRLLLARLVAGSIGVWAVLGLLLVRVGPSGSSAWLPYEGGAVVIGALAVALLAGLQPGGRAAGVRATALAAALAVAGPALIVAMHGWELADRLPPPLDIAGVAAALSVLLGAALSALSPHRWPNRLFYRAPEDLPLLTRVVTLAFAAPLLLPVLQRLGRGLGLPLEYAALIAQLGSTGLLLWALVTVVAQRHRLARRVAAQRRDLAEAEEQFRLMFEHAPIGMATIAVDRRLRRVNRAFCELLGRRASELEGRPLAELTHPEDVGLDEEHFAACLRGELDRYHTEKRYRHARGEWIVGELSIALVRDEQGAPQHFVGQMVDRTRERALEADLRHAAHHDPLTGLANRRLLEERISKELDRTAREGGVVGVLVVDLDGFKAINDRYGHDVGDVVLTVTSQRLVDASRSFDTVARIGGDEFLVCTALTEPEELPELAARIRRAVNQPLQHRGEEIFVRGSVGAVVGRAGDSLVELMRGADARMYAAKHAGSAPG